MTVTRKLSEYDALVSLDECKCQDTTRNTGRDITSKASISIAGR